MPEMNVDRGGGRQDKVNVDYPGNSHSAKKGKPAAKDRPKVEPVVGHVVERRRGIASELIHNFVQEDARTVLGYLMLDVLVPAAKNTILDFFNQGLERTLFGDATPRRSYGRSTTAPAARTNYQGVSVSRLPKVDPRPPLSRQARATHNFAEYVLQTRGEAEDVLDGLRELIDRFGVASVMDMYDLLGITPEFTDNNWGWENLDHAGVRAVRGGYILNLPPTVPITQ